MLSLTVYILRVEKKLSLSLLSIGSSSGSEEGNGDRQMTSELLIKAFSMKATQQNLENTVKNPMNLVFDVQMRYAADFMVTDRQIDRQNDYRNPAAHAPRVNNTHIQWNLSIYGHCWDCITCPIFFFSEVVLYTSPCGWDNRQCPD